MPSINEDITKASDWIAAALRSSGYNIDFSVQSLQEIDRFYDEHTVNGAPRPNGLFAADLGSRIFAVGSYVGEVIRRVKGGEWNGDDSDPQVKLHVELRLKDGTLCWPTQRAMNRLRNGREDGIVAFAQGLGVSVEESSKNAGKGFFQRLFGK
jgi:hypothetical protein